MKQVRFAIEAVVVLSVFQVVKGAQLALLALIRGIERAGVRLREPHAWASRRLDGLMSAALGEVKR